jgi:hypothetical protein
MTQRKFFICMGLMVSWLCEFVSFVPATTAARSSHHRSEPELTEAVAGAVAVSVVSHLKGDKFLRSAYNDTLRILERHNSCSDFFGGSDFSVRVLNEFVARIDKEYVSRDIGMRMFGRETIVVSEGSTKRYRLFDKVTLNQNGPFYRRRMPASEIFLPNIGSFEPGTDRARVLMLLHELGHLIENPQGKWLLPNDGADEYLSRENSVKVERVCGVEIRSLGKSTKN